MFPPDWSPMIPMLMAQCVWVSIIIVVLSVVMKRLLREEGDRVTTSLAPLLKRLEQLGYISSEQAALNASTLQRVISKQVDATAQVDGVPKTTADLVADNIPVVLKTSPPTP